MGEGVQAMTAVGKYTNRQNKPGGVLHVDLTRAEARIAHAMMLVEGSDELRQLSEIHTLIEKAIASFFGDAPRPKVQQ